MNNEDDTKMLRTAMIILGSIALVLLLGQFSIVVLDKEIRRQEIVQQSHCEHYGPSIAQWAADKGIKNPCE